LSDSKENESEITGRKDGLVILLSDADKVTSYRKLIRKYTSEGGTVVTDIRAICVKSFHHH